MKDREITALFRERREEALEAAIQQYGSLCLSVAMGVLGNREDAQEAVNDALLRAWNSIPPQDPELLDAYLAKLTRRAAIDRLRRDRAKRRWSGEAALALEELGEVLTDGRTAEDALETGELAALISRFLRSRSETERRVFLRRYWYVESISVIAADLGFSESKVKSMLHRTKKSLGMFLEKEGYR